MRKTISKETCKRAVIYCRVSTKEQVDDGNSLVSQERICREYAHKEGYELVEIFIEKGESAKTADRQEWQRLLAFCENKKNAIDAVIAYKIDRISRNIADYSYFKVRLKKHNVNIKSVTEFFEDTPAGRFMENIIANVGQFDNDVRTERSVGGMREAVLEGRYVWMAPYGYDNVRDVRGKATIKPNDKAPLMKEVFESIAQRMYSSDQIRLIMAEKGLVNKNGSPITRGNFFRLIRNPLYMGHINRLGITAKATFEPIVSEQLFATVQNILKGRKNSTKNYIHERPDFPLRRFVQHPSGKKLTGYWSQGRSAKYPYYSFGLPSTSYAKQKLETAFLEFLSDYAFDFRHINVLKHYLEVAFKKHVQGQETNREAIDTRIAEINEHIDKLVKLQLDGGISVSLLAQRTQTLEKELERLVELLQERNEKTHDITGLLTFAAEILQNPQILWEKASFEARKLFQWFGFPQGIVFDGKKFRTAEICSLFRLKEIIDSDLLSVVNYRNGRKNPSQRLILSEEQKIYHSKEYWTKIAEDLRGLREMMSGDN